MNRNPNNRGPRQLRDCTFQDWADPIERPAPKQTNYAGCVVFVAALLVAAWVLL